MHPIFYYIILFMVLGAIGMAIANKKVDKKTALARWLKYITYVFITGSVVASVFFNFFPAIAVLICSLSMTELIVTGYKSFQKQKRDVLISFVWFIPAAIGFILFSIKFSTAFLLFIYFQVLIFDAFCQITGQLFGRTPLVPSISPGKTIEGLIGGFFCCMLVAAFTSDWVHFSRITGLLFGMVTIASSFTGDILASSYKRKIGIKDYSNWLPGQGGFLDRFDSFLFTGFVYYILHVFIFKEEFNNNIVI